MKRNLNQMDRADLIEYIRELEQENERLHKEVPEVWGLEDDEFDWDYQEEAF